MLRAFADQVDNSPAGYTMFLTAVDFIYGKKHEIVVIEGMDPDETSEILDSINANFIPGKVLLFKSMTVEMSGISDIAGYVEPMERLNGLPTVYVCENYQCNLPVTDIARVFELIK